VSRQIDYEGRELKIGEEIILFNSDYKPLGIAKYLCKKMTSFKIETPKFKLKNKIYFGFETWWIPRREATEAGIV